VLENGNKILIVSPLFCKLHDLSFLKFIAGSQLFVIHQVEFVSL